MTRKQNKNIMSTSSDSLLCFQHCEKVNIFCFMVPYNCPKCRSDLSGTDMAIPPFRIPNPLTCEPNNFSLVIKPTFGSFIRDFKRGDLLHIALSNSKSIIFEFNENGISSSSASSHLNWTNFLCISLSALPYRFEDLDEILETTKVMDIWAAERIPVSN
ncbi:MKRN2 opposite strand protein isoform X2 [Daphnia magna]|uniref:MKRN2 opposite strand protein isoform X2 n=1 Tax=Daphnia magna TaxID=35525 RepID=UPI001E1BAE18|nr:MKRN2 opposite strand protein isoform X2 [Daphnia magna]